MLLQNDEFLTALSELFTATREEGGVTLTMKRYDFEGVKQQRQKKRAATGTDEAAMELLVSQMSLDGKEYATLVRAATPKKKLSTLVDPADLATFLAQCHGFMLANVDSIKKNDRQRRKRAAIKRNKAAKAKRLRQKQASA